jgi:hypothetical protein
MKSGIKNDISLPKKKRGWNRVGLTQYQEIVMGSGSVEWYDVKRSVLIYHPMILRFNLKI